MDCPPSGAERINSFALVCYLPGELGAFVDRLRTELVSSCMARSHVTVLPPRSLSAPEHAAMQQIAGCVPDHNPFRIELGSVEIFPKTKVIYLGLRAGHERLQRLHDILNAEALGFDEPFEYHPHVTLAQELNPDHVDETLELAAARWSEFRHSRCFDVDSLIFVQNTASNRWLDLVTYELGSMAAMRR